MHRRYHQPHFIQRRIANRQHREYEELKRAIFKHLGARRTFVRDIDVTLVNKQQDFMQIGSTLKNFFQAIKAKL